MIISDNLQKQVLSLAKFSEQEQKNALFKPYELTTGAQSYNIEFIGAKRRFDFLEFFLFKDKSDVP